MSRNGFIRGSFGDLLVSRDERLPNDGTHPLYSLTIKDGVTPKTERYEREFLVTNKESKKYKVVRAGDLVFNPSNLRWGAIATSYIQFPVLASPIYEVFYPKDTQILDPYFLGALASSPIFMAKYLSLVEGTLVERTALKKDDFLNIEIEIPPLPEQKKIAEILSGVDRCIQTKRSLINKVESTMRALKEDLMTGQEEWQEFELGDLLNFRNGLNTEKDNFGRGVPFVSYKDVYSGGIVNSKMLKQRVSLSAVEEERFSLQSGDILFTRTSETPEEIGFTCVFDDNHGSAVFNGFCIRGRPLEEGKLMPEFVSFYLRSEYVLTQMRFLCKYTTRAGISAESLSQVRVHIPDQETQKRLADSLLSVNRYRAAQEVAIKNLKNIKKSVSADLLSGRKRVTL